MYDRGKIVTGIVIGLALFLFPFYYNAGGAKKAPEAGRYWIRTHAATDAKGTEAMRVAAGKNAAADTSPAQPACPVSVVTRIPTATVSIHVPMFETNAPAQNRA